MRYIAGAYATVPCRFPQAQFIVLPRNGDPHCFITTSFSCYALREEMPWLKNKIWAPPIGLKWCPNVEDLEPHMDKIVPIIIEHGLADGVIGLDGCSSELVLSEAFHGKGIKNVKGAQSVMFEARKIKNEDEIACMRLACASAEAAFDDMKQAIRPGIRECDLVGIGMKKLYELGADEVMEFVCSSGPRTNPLHIDYTDRQIRPGDLICIDINGNSYMGYKSCYYRTFSCGKPTELQKEVYEKTRVMMYAGMKNIKPGNTTADICAAWPQSPKHWGYDNWLDVSGYALGHGLGLGLHEAPSIFKPATAKSKPEVLEEGMVIAVETWEGGEDPRYGKFGVRLEEDIVVTKDGYELLTLYPVDELVECAF
jgi:Xaa-Pro dipeptidase